MDETDLPLDIPISVLSDHFMCAICICQMKDAAMTHCGHRFCSACIREWVDRKHSCPCCNKQLDEGKLIKDFGFDGLIATASLEKDKSEDKYFDTLLGSATLADTIPDADKFFSPIEPVLKKHLKSSLLAHEKYYKDLKKEFLAKERKLEAECQDSIDGLHLHGLSEEEILQQTADLQSVMVRQIQCLQDELTSCTMMVTDAFDRYLSNHLPDLEILPVQISIKLLNKKSMIKNYSMKPETRIDELRSVVESYLAQQNNPVVAWAEDVKFILFGPFSKNTYAETLQICQDVVELGTPHSDVHILHEDVRPVMQFNMKPGSEIVIWGDIKQQSDLPKRCFLKEFSADTPKTVDYYKCAQCNFGWICKTCADVCHKDHTTVPYILNHQPTWACCYCPKKKMCQLLE